MGGQFKYCLQMTIFLIAKIAQRLETLPKEQFKDLPLNTVCYMKTSLALGLNPTPSFAKFWLRGWT